VTFGGRVLGIETLNSSRLATDSPLGVAGVTFAESDRNADITDPPLDTVTVAGNTVTVHFGTRPGIDEVRVITVAHQDATRLKANPAVLELKPLSLPLLRLRTRLTDSGSGAPLPGQTIKMTAGSTTIWQATTDSNGVARCNALSRLIPVVLALGYKASFAGTPTLKPSSASAGVIG
jgi:hypothetical protein